MVIAPIGTTAVNAASSRQIGMASIFLAPGTLCVIALLPALFLAGRKPLRIAIRSTGSDMIMNIDRV